MGIPEIVAIVLVIVLLTGLRIAQEYERGVVFRLGRYVALRGPGLYWIIPLGLERAVTIDIRTRTVSAEQQETITRDSVTVKLNAVLWYRITDAAKSVIRVADAPAAVYQLALTSLRNSIGQHDLDEVLQERDKINSLLRANIAESTGAWGVEVERFEMKDVELPVAMQEVMAMQAGDSREARAHHQGGSRTRSLDHARGGGAADGEQSGGGRTATHADGDRSRGGEQQHDGDDDSVGLRFDGQEPWRISARADLGQRVRRIVNLPSPAAARRLTTAAPANCLLLPTSRADRSADFSR